MVKNRIILVSLLILCCCSNSEGKLGTQAVDQYDDMTEVIISFNETVSEEVVEDADGSIIEIIDVAPIATAIVPINELEEIERNPLVEHVEEDQVVTIHNETDNWGINRIHAPFAWNANFTGKGVRVAVIDTGIDTRHEDLQIVGGISTVHYTDSYHDDNGHGTHVAGILAALHNGNGIRGVAPDVDLFAVKSLDADGSGSLSSIIHALEWSISNNMDIINLSIGMTNHSNSLKLMVDRAYEQGILLVGSAGNNGTANIDNYTVNYPAKYDSVIAVGATDTDNERGRFSTQANAYSATGPALEISAPGIGIYSTYLNNGYQNMSGTSMSAPFVSGALAVLKEKHPTFTNTQLRSRLTENVKDLGEPNRDVIFGHGLVRIPEEYVRKTVEIFGANRYLTGIEVSRRGWPEGSDVVVLGRGDQPIDALTSSVLASKFQSPLLLTRPDRLLNDLLLELNRLQPSKIYLAGGDTAISPEIEKNLRQQGYPIQRIRGRSRFDTAVKIASEVGTTNEVFLTTANEQSPDALSIAPYAGMMQIPILLTARDHLSSEVVSYFHHNEIRKVTIIGGTQVISEKIRDQLRQLGVTSIEGISGESRFSTSIEVVKRFEKDFDFSNVSFASGRSFIDALPASPYSSSQRSPIILTDTNHLPKEVQTWMNEQNLSRTTFTILGGTHAITENTRFMIRIPL
ncbi:S8 family serine peptidase [Bacillus suaedae]|uniref:S8 family serine peptidase n=1 Tax=Halalkalibacter suaedae TaxID=2822140 RepID=A0A941ARH5_9BACI|nr:S8 family serine peptidase [Bacillus suaedae]MBP3952633.1 S8 family serine peptidase [Bacillus suaedae]